MKSTQSKNGSRGPDPRSGGPRSGEPRSGEPRSGEPRSGTPRSGTPTPWGDDIGSFGTWLRCQREGRGIDLRAIADESKVGLTYLRAFEEDRFDILPAAVFAKGFLRQYARYVGLDPDEVVNFYLFAHDSDRRQEEAKEPPPAPRPRRGLVWPALGLAAAAALVLVWLLTRGSDGRPPSSPEAPLPTVAAQVPAAAPAVTEPPLPAAESGPRVAPPEASPEAAGEAAPPAATPLRITLDFSAECWVEASIDGERRIAENRVQGESLLLEAAERVELTVGNVDAVEMEVNGRSFEFDPVPGTKVRNQSIDLDTVAALTGGARGRG